MIRKYRIPITTVQKAPSFLGMLDTEDKGLVDPILKGQMTIFFHGAL